MVLERTNPGRLRLPRSFPLLLLLVVVELLLLVVELEVSSGQLLPNTSKSKLSELKLRLMEGKPTRKSSEAVS